MTTDIVRRGTRNQVLVPTGEVLKLFPDTANSRVNVTIMTPGIAGGPYLGITAATSIGPFSDFVQLQIEGLMGRTAYDVGPAVGGTGYALPTSGVPKSDLNATVQTSLGKADTAYQLAAGGIPETDLSTDVRNKLAAVGTGNGYVKPLNGIPSSDLSAAVQEALVIAESAYVKPVGGVPKSDLIAAVQTSLNKADAAVPVAAIVDNLTSDVATVPGSAKQLKVLKALIDALASQGGSGTPVNPITVTNDFPSIPEDTTLTGNVLTNDTATSGTLVVTQFSVAGVATVTPITAGGNASQTVTGKGTFTLASSGAYTFVPVADFNGTVPTLTYQVSNGLGSIAQGNLAVTVTSVNDNPNAVADTYGMVQGNSITVNPLVNDTDIDADTLSITQINGQSFTVDVAITITNATVVVHADKTITYTPSASVTGAQTFTYTVSDGKGGTSVGGITVTIAPTGSSSATPVIGYVDRKGGCISGGENGLGCYLRISGWNFGAQADLGTRTKVYIGGVEVANYRYLLPQRNAAKNGMQEIAVQVGPIGNPATNGSASLPITVVRDGTASSVNFEGQTINFIPWVGDVYFAALTGNDSTAVVNDIAHPWRNLQTSTPGPSYVINGGISNVSGYGAGDDIVVRGGAWSDIAFESAWFRFRLATNQGKPKQWMHFTVYPGPILGHAPEVVKYSTPAGAKGGFQGPGSSYAGTCGDYVSISGFEADIAAGAQSDACFINSQSAYEAWLVTGNKVGPWPSTVLAKGGALISGHGTGTEVYGNEGFGFACTGGLENHGIYADTGASGWRTRFNYIHDITGGNAYQQNDPVGLVGNNFVGWKSGWLGFTDMIVSHNWFEGYAKYGFNLATNSVSGKYYCNVMRNGTYAAIRTDIAGPSLPIDITFVNNTFYNCDCVQSGSGNGQFLNSNGQGTFPTGSKMLVQQNIFCAGPNTYAGSSPYAGNNDYPAPWQVRTQNLYYGPNQSTPWTSTNYASTDTGSSAMFADPLFTNAANGDFSLQASSPAIDAATIASPFTISTDFTSILSRPQGAQRDIGAFEVASSKPYVTAAPTMSGSAQVGVARSASTGTWGNAPISSYTYQWVSATTNGGTPTNLSGNGAATNTYTPQVADQGKYVDCIVTATNTSGSTAYRVAGGVVAASASAPANTTQPSITGTGAIGNVLTRVAGAWTPASGANQATITWVWRRAGVAISGTDNQATYTQVLADDGKVIDIVETGTNSFGSVTVGSSNTITVPHTQSAPTLIGTDTAFNTSATTVTVTKSVLAGDYVVLAFGVGNGDPGGLTITDSMGGASADWGSVGATSGGNSNSGARIRKVPTDGSMVITIGKDGGTFYCGTAMVVRGGDPTTIMDGAAVATLFTTSPNSVTPTATTFAKDLQIAIWGGTDARYATGFTYSDSFRSSSNDATVSRQCQVQTRTTSTTGAHAAFVFTYGGGTSGSDPRSGVTVLNFRGV